MGYKRHYNTMASMASCYSPLIGGVIVIAAVTAWCIWDGKQKEKQPASP